MPAALGTQADLQRRAMVGVTLPDQKIPPAPGTKADLQRTALAYMVLEHSKLDIFDRSSLPRTQRNTAQMFGQLHRIENLRESLNAKIGKRLCALSHCVAPVSLNSWRTHSSAAWGKAEKRLLHRSPS